MAVEPYWSAFIRPDGSLGGRSVRRRETIYQTLSGKRVERFYDHERSYIYKPLHAAVSLRELWASEHVAPRLSGITIPHIVAASAMRESAAASPWLIYEDLGELQHGRHAQDIIEAAGWIPEWHLLPLEIIPEAFSGHTPRHDCILESVQETKGGLYARLIDVELAAVQAWMERIDDLESRIPALTVVSHGDYHPLNIAFNRGERIVLDWEFIHRNHPYWDLYSLMDITSFRYDKVELTHDEREQALRRYWQQLQEGLSRHADALWRELDEGAFIRGYYWYASLYSAWIAGLIEQDLVEGRIAAQLLYKQKEQTSKVFADCLLALGL